MAKKGGGRSPKKRGGPGGGRPGRPPRGGGRPGGPGGKGRKRGPGKTGPTTDYFMQPGKGGAVIVLRRPIGNRATPKVCGVLPTKVHAKMLMEQLIRAESVVKDLFLEATDDGIEALEAILTANCEDVLRKGPRYEPFDNNPGGARDLSGQAADDPASSPEAVE